MRRFKENEIVVLLGAGASVDAGIPNSPKMIENVEQLVESEWSDFKLLYHYVRSAIHYAGGIAGRFGDQVPYNIEILVNTLDELRKKDEHPLYPFVGAWNPKLVEVGGRDFDVVKRFRKKIVEKLQHWIALDRYKDAAGYYKGLVQFQQQYEHPLRVFTLNYDLCVEEVCDTDGSVERGFDADRKWDWRRFDENENDPKEIYLYKLHGSADWTRKADESLTYLDSPQKIAPDDVALIFGTSYKLQYVDPFLFFAYELRRRTLDDARLIISIGYGFGDEHINGILRQAINANSERQLLSVAPLGDNTHGTTEAEAAEIAESKRIASIMSLARPGQVHAWSFGAKKFMGEMLDVTLLGGLFPSEEEELFAEVAVDMSKPGVDAPS